jgi:hypothetical protein
MTDDTGLFRGNKFGIPNFTPLKALGDYSYKGGPTVEKHLINFRTSTTRLGTSWFSQRKSLTSKICT